MPVLGFLIVTFLYFLPAAVGWNKRNFSAIFWMNFLLGWTVAGWIASLIWALTKDADQPKVIVNQSAPPPAPAPPPALLCVLCGKYSASGAKFCSSCGAQTTS